MTWISVSLTITRAGATVPAKSTSVTPAKPVPVRVTTAPIGPEGGSKLVTLGPGSGTGTGAGSTVKEAVEVATPPWGVVTVIGPVLSPGGTCTRICFPVDCSLKVSATTPPNATWVSPSNPVPWMTTTVPGAPDSGVNEAMVGAATVIG